MSRIFTFGKIKFYILFILFFLLLLLSDGMRTAGYSSIPEPNGILDERTNVWVGLSIRKTGIPSAWTELAIYKDLYWEKYGNAAPEITATGFNFESNNEPISLATYNDYPKPLYTVKSFDFSGEERAIAMVQPYLDHPPLGGLILSSLVSDQVKDFSELTPREFRRTSLLLANITFILLFILGWLIFKNPLAGLLSATIYGFTPTFLLVSRYALLENVLIPLSVATFIVLYLIKNYPTKHKLRISLLTTVAILSGLAILVKITGIYLLIGSLLFLYFAKTPLKTLFIVAITSLAIGFLYILWGLFLLPTSFFAILYYQSASRVFSGSLATILNIFKFGIASFPVDGFWIGGFLSLPLLLKSKELYPLGLVAIISLLTLLFLGAGAFPWYFMIFIPFVCLAVTQLILQIYREPSTELLTFFFVTFFMSSFFWAVVAPQYEGSFQNSQLSFFIFRITLILAAFIIFFMPYGLKKHYLSVRYWQICWSIILIICLKLNFTSFLFMLGNWSNITYFFTLNWRF